jgi:hypothetical protein
LQDIAQKQFAEFFLLLGQLCFRMFIGGVLQLCACVGDCCLFFLQWLSDPAQWSVLFGFWVREAFCDVSACAGLMELGAVERQKLQVLVQVTAWRPLRSPISNAAVLSIFY